MARKTEKVENLEMSTVGREYGKKTEKSWKMRNIHLTTLKMTQITKKREKMRNAILKDLEYGGEN